EVPDRTAGAVPRPGPPPGVEPEHGFEIPPVPRGMGIAGTMPRCGGGVTPTDGGKFVMGDAIGDGTLYRRLLRLARPCAPQLIMLLALDLLDGVWILLTPLPLKIAIDSVIGSR